MVQLFLSAFSFLKQRLPLLAGPKSKGFSKN
jgi:hypothetical protein